MRWWQERRSRSSLTLLLLILPVTYLLTLTYTRRGGQQEPLTLLVSRNEVQKIISARNVSLSSSSSSPSTTTTTKTTSKPGDLNFVVINNKIFRRNEWPPLLQLSEAADLYRLDFSKFTPEEREFLEERREVMRERAQAIKRTCENRETHKTNLPVNSNFVFDQKHSPNIAWCPNYKVASTTWMINFLKLAHFNDDNPDIPDVNPEKKNRLKFSHKYGATHPAVYQLYPTPATDALKLKVFKRSVRVIIVRHPFTRLLSAYRDKMTKKRPLPAEFNFKGIQKKIKAKYRPRDSNITSPFPTFPEFVQYVIDVTETLHTAKQWRNEVKCWVPYWAQCGVCTADYNIIMKLETLPEDDRFLITLASLTELQKSGSEWRHLNNVSSTQAAPQYYRQLTTQQMLGLYHNYKEDFDLFEYTLDEYLPLATDAEK